MLIAVHTLFHTVLMAFITFEMTLRTALIAFVINDLIPFQIVWKNVLIAVHAIVHAVWTVCHAFVSHPTKLCHNCCPVCVCMKNQTSPATSAAIAVTSSMIGFAFITALKMSCAAAAILTAVPKAPMTPTAAPIPTAMGAKMSALSLTNVTTSATASPILPNWLEMPLIMPEMLSTPMASMTFCHAFCTRFCTFSIEVPMPCVASLACCVKLAYWPKPSVLRRFTAPLKSSNDTLPFFMASYRSLPFFPAPRSDSAIWLSWPGIAA